MNVQIIGVWWWIFGSRSTFKVTPEVFSWDWEITIKPFIRRGWPNTFVHIVCIYIYIFFLGPLFCHPVHAAVAYNYSDRCWEIYQALCKASSIQSDTILTVRQFVWMLKVTCLLLYSFSLLRIVHTWFLCIVLFTGPISVWQWANCV